MDPVSVIASIIAILQATASVVQYINDVKDSRQERITLRNEISSASWPLHMLRDRIVQEQKRLDTDDDGADESWLSSVLILGTAGGPLEQFKIVLDELERKIAPPGRKGKGKTIQTLGKMLTWPFQKDDIERYLRMIERQKSTFYLALQNDNLSLAQAIKEDTSLLPEMAINVAEIADKVSKIHLSGNVSESRTIVRWLSPINFFPTHEDIFRRREPGTGQWFLDSTEYRSWVDCEGETLWCPGIPGAGKTMLSSIVVDSLRARFEGSTDIGVASIYCNYKEQLQQTPVNLLAGLWMQLLRGNAHLSDDVKQLYEEHVDQDTRPTLTNVAEVLKKEVARYQKIYVIIDALDECSELCRMELLEKVQALQPIIRLFVTSRPYDSIAREFAGYPKLEIKASTEDVRAYVAGRISKGSRLAGQVRKDPSLAKDIEKVVVRNAQSMFLLAQLHMDSLQSKASSKAVRKTLDTLPKDLDSTYEEAMRRIEGQSEDDKQLAEQILQWISFAIRPLSLAELQEALAVEPDTQEVDEDNINDAELLTSVCAGLVTFDQDSQVIRLVHFSTQEYFKRIRSVRFPTAQDYIGRTCLTYLSFDDFEAGPCSDDAATVSRIQKHHLLPYAAENWGEHVRGGPEKDMTDKILEFFEDETKLSSSVQVMHFNSYRDWYAGVSTSFPRHVTGLHLAAHFGLEYIANILLKQGVSIAASDSFGATALHKAAEAGHKNIVQLLLEHGADIEAHDSNGHTALHQATQCGSRSVVLLLLEKGAKISEAVDGRTALHFAAEVGNEAIATALIGGGADVTAGSYTVGDEHQSRFYSGRTPLHWAAANGSDGLVRLLLERGAEVNALNVSNRTPLQEAIMFGHVAVVKTLLENGASVSIKNTEGWTPLHEAAWKSPPVVAEMLIDRNAEIDAANKSPVLGVPEAQGEDQEIGCGGLTPLHLAAVSGRYDLFEVLKNRGADIERRDGFGLTTLHRAVQGGSVDILRSLLDMCIDVDIRGGLHKETPLQKAASLGMVDCISYLLKRGADAKATNALGENAFHLAEASGNREAAILLSEYSGRGGKTGEI